MSDAGPALGRRRMGRMTFKFSQPAPANPFLSSAAHLLVLVFLSLFFYLPFVWFISDFTHFFV